MFKKTVVVLCLYMNLNLTSEVINLFFLQQTDSVIVSLQHQLGLWVLGDHRLAAEILLGLRPFLLLFCTCLTAFLRIFVKCYKKINKKEAAFAVQHITDHIHPEF